METQNQMKKLDLVKSSRSFKMIIPKNVEEKIRYLCQKIWKDEWSGVLFYTPEGHIEDNTLVIVCKDIYVMDIGSSTYTEFNMSPDVVSYMTENSELLDCQMGLIHSHNQMSTFFSGTDLNTLKEEGLDRNHFVSLIVNNEGTYTAGITRKIKYVRNITEEFCYNTFNNGIIKDSDNYSVEDESIEWFNLDIIVENTDFSDISNRLQEIKDNKRRLVNTNPIVNNGPININSHSNIFIPDVNKDEELPFDWDFIDNNADIPYGRITFNKDIIKSLTLQLVTGSCIISNESKIDINKWAQGMENLFNKRFQSANSKMFTAWAENFIEYFCFYTEDPKLHKTLNDESAEMAILAYDLIKSLSKLPSNNYIKVYIKILKDYLL